MPPREGVYGLLAEFNTPSELVHATEMAHRAGYRRMECYTPYPVEEAAEALRFHKTRVPMMCLLGGIMGLTTGFLLEMWVNVWGYPLNIRATPLFSWPAFVIPEYELTILFAGLFDSFRHDRAERFAAVVSPTVQCAELCKRSDDGQVLPLS